MFKIEGWILLGIACEVGLFHGILEKGGKEMCEGE